MEYHVFIKTGDARPEVDSLLKELGVSAGEAGLHKTIFAERARQTVVMLTRGDAPLAGALRGRKGWQEPGAGGGA